MNSARIILASMLLVFNEKLCDVHSYRIFDVDGVENILAMENESIDIQCKQDDAMAYCGFIHPSGKRFSFSGNELIDGHCSIRITATVEDSGQWSCHIGKNTIGVELMQKINVRVVGKVAAVENNITAIHGKEVTMQCATTKGFMPLSYCRFEPPIGTPFSIGAGVNRTHPILGRYYYPMNMSLDRGDCAVTIRNVKYEDVGIWTCGASLGDGKEHTDRIKLVVEGIYTMSTASTTGVTFGALGVVVFLILLGYFGWKKRRILGARPRAPEMIEVQELGLPRHSERSPRTTRAIPSVHVQSPSERGSTPSVH